jgi:ABC-type dipeptide/oligopeptide/nickel transport system permease subunit
VSISAPDIELQVRPSAAGDEVASLKGEAWRRLRKNRLAVAGIVIISVITLAAIFADVIATQPTDGFVAEDARQGPSARHWFGTDQLGRDMFSRVVHGARFSLIVGFTVVGMILLVGLTVGGIAGYYGGVVDSIMSRLIDVFLAFPYLVGALILVTALGKSKFALVIALASLAWVTIARLFRGSVIAIRNSEFVDAARALGAGNARVLFRHVFPNAVTPTLVYACALVGSVVISEAALTYLGAGLSEPEASWGLMIRNGQSYLTTEPYMVLFPSLGLTLTVLGFVLLGDGLRDSLDPRLR